MGLYAALGISATGMGVQRLRMDVVANNLANADSTTGVGDAYRRKIVALAPAPGGPAFALPRPAGVAAGESDLHGVAATQILEDQRPLRRVYEPGHPLADARGYVTRPNVDVVTEMVDMVAATRSFQANVTAFEASKTMARDALRLIQ